MRAIANYVTKASLAPLLEDGETIRGDCHTSYLTLRCFSAARSQTFERNSQGQRDKPPTICCAVDENCAEDFWLPHLKQPR